MALRNRHLIFKINKIEKKTNLQTKISEILKFILFEKQSLTKHLLFFHSTKLPGTAQRKKYYNLQSNSSWLSLSSCNCYCICFAKRMFKTTKTSKCYTDDSVTFLNSVAVRAKTCSQTFL